MPPPTIQEVMQIPNRYGNMGQSVNGLAEYLANQQQMKQEYAMKMQFMQAQQQAQMANEIAARRAQMQMEQQDPLHKARLQEVQQNIGQNGQMPLSMQWQAQNQAAQQQAEQERMIAVERAKRDYEETTRTKRMEEAKQMFPEMFGGQPQQFASQSNFNPFMGQANPVFKGRDTSIGGINFNQMNPVSQGQPQPSNRVSMTEGYGINPNFMTGGSNEMFAKKPDSTRSDRLRNNDYFNKSDKMRDDFDKLSKDYRTIRDSYSKIQSSATNPSAAGDLSLIFGYMRMLDPTSTVREGEFATAQNSGSVPDRVRATYNKIISGERLSESQRKDFLNTAKTIYSSQSKIQQSNIDLYKKRATKFGVDPEDVITDLYNQDSVDSANGQASSPVSIPGVPQGRIAVIDQKGNKFTIPQEQLKEALSQGYSQYGP